MLSLVDYKKTKGRKLTLINLNKDHQSLSGKDDSELVLNPKFINDLARVRKEVKEGKYTRYNNAQEILDELGL